MGFVVCNTIFNYLQEYKTEKTPLILYLGVPSSLAPKIIRQVDPKFATVLMAAWTIGYKQFEQTAILYNKYGGGNERYKSSDKMLKAQFNNDFGAISALTVMNDMRELIDDYFKNPKEKQHNVVRAIFAYTASRTINSSPFVISKD